MLRMGALGRASEPLESSSTSSRLTREQVVDRILSLNPTASREYLSQFRDEALGRYLDHLTAASEPRGRAARWIRPGDSPAITWRQARV